jgi:long-chain acyl-CoA synthetase
MTPADVVLAALPLAQAFGQTCGLNASVLAGASLVLLARLDPRRVLARIVQDRVTILHGEPSIYAALLDHPRRLDRGASALRLCVSGESALAPDVSSGFEAAFGCPILEGYGLSEASPVACLNRPGPVPRPGSIGHPVDGVEMRILDPEDGLGEIAIRGHNVMKGYWNDPEATAAVIDADGWLSTGDIGRVDEHGRFYLLDRKQDVILRGGRLVYPREVERALGEHPAVREAAVIGRAHPELGEEVCAAVVLGDRTAADPSELAAFVRERVAAYKCPRHVWVVDELPKTPTGKVLKRDIEVPDQVLDRHAAS